MVYCMDLSLEFSLVKVISAQNKNMNWVHILLPYDMIKRMMSNQHQWIGIRMQYLCKYNYSWSLFWFLLITEGAPSRLQRNSSFAFRNHSFRIPTFFEMNFRTSFDNMSFHLETLYSLMALEFYTIYNRLMDIKSFYIWCLFCRVSSDTKWLS